MAGNTTTNYAFFSDPEYLAGIQRAVYEDSSIFRLFNFKPEGQSCGGDSIDWRVEAQPTTYAGAYSEDDPAPYADSVSGAKAAVAYQPFQARARVTQQVLDYSDRAIQDPWTHAMQTATESLINSINTTLGSTLIASVAAASTYAGLTRSSYTSVLVSGVEASSTALTKALVNAAIQSLNTGSTTTHPAVPLNKLAFFVGEAMYRIMVALQAPTIVAATNAGMPYPKIRSVGDYIDLGDTYGPNFAPATWDGIPIVIAPWVSSGTLLLGDPTTIEIHEKRKPWIKPLGAENASDDALILADYQVANLKPSHWYKMTSKS